MNRFLELSEIMLGADPGHEWNAWDSPELAELTKPQVVALLRLRGGPLRMSDLAARLCVSHSSATALVDRLTRKGLVERVHGSGDRRQVLCRLTDSGKDRVEAFWSGGRRRVLDVTGRLELTELETVVEAFEILVAAGRRTARARG